MLMNFSQSVQVLCTMDSWSLIYLIMKAANLVIVLALPPSRTSEALPNWKVPCLNWYVDLQYSARHCPCGTFILAVHFAESSVLHADASNYFQSKEGYFFFPAEVSFLGGFLVLCFPVSLLFCFSAFLLLCFSASLLFAFPASLLFAFPASLLFLLFLLLCFLLLLLLCFSASLFSLLLCFCISVPFYFYYYTFSFLQSCVFATPLPAPLLLCFLSLLSLCFSFSFASFCSVMFCLYPKWNPREALGETQRNPKEIMIRNPTWNPKWTLKKP